MAEARVLKILLGDVPAGHVTSFAGGKHLFTFDDSYINLGPRRPVLSLSFNAPGDEEAAERQLREVHSSRMKLPPFLSNLLPEGVLHEYMVKQLKIHHDHEFDLLMALGASLPGAVRAIPADQPHKKAIDAAPDAARTTPGSLPVKFSLGGTQLKFSMIERGGRFTLAEGGDEWIVKPPHPIHANVPANEYTMMLLAAAAGIEVPEVKLVKLDDIDLGGYDGPGGFAGLAGAAGRAGADTKKRRPGQETLAYAIKRYDRNAGATPQRTHAEDFAQVFSVYASEEYKATNYDTIGRLIFDLFPNRFEQITQFVRRLTVNLLIGNGDAHLKNWSVIYQDGITPQLSPAYDLVSTIHYVSNDSLALNLGGEKRFEAINQTHFDRLARRMEAPPKFVLDVVRETVAAAQEKWPGVIRRAGLPKPLREGLHRHWGRLSSLLRIRR